jgi:TPR repeat protein
MSLVFNDEVIADCVWSVISQSRNSADFLTYLMHFPGSVRHRSEAIDKAVATYTPGMNSVQSCYYGAPDALRKLAETTTDQKTAANAWFNIGKMLHNGYGVVIDPLASIQAYERAIDLGELRSLVNLASHYESGSGVEIDLDRARTLFQQAADSQVSLGYLRLADMLPDEELGQRIALHFKAAEMNDPVAHYRIALHYRKGEGGIDKDLHKSLEWMTRAAHAGHAYAHYHLGWIYEHGRHIEKDQGAAAEWYRLGSDRLDPSCLSALGLLYLYGESVEENYESAVKLFRQAAVLGELSAQRRLGRELIWGRLNKTEDARQQSEGISWLKLADAAGDKRSAELLAKVYRSGAGVEKDLVKSSEYLLKAAKAGIADAQGQMGLNYWSGSGVEKNHAEAYKWLSICALQGDGRGLFLLGRATEAGIGCKKNPREAFRLYTLSAEQEEPDAIYQLGECCYYGVGTEKDPPQAVVYYRRAAALGNASAKTDLGWMLYEGEHVLTNYEEAAKWFLEAANQDEPRAMYFLALLYENGDGVEQNDDVCRRWMSRAAMLDYKPAKDWIEKNLPKAPGWLEQLVKPNE